jgi:hypothetical protein
MRWLAIGAPNGRVQNADIGALDVAFDDKRVYVCESMAPGFDMNPVPFFDRIYWHIPLAAFLTPSNRQECRKNPITSQLLTCPSGKLSAFSQIKGSETENLRRRLVPGKVVPVLFSASHTSAIALERWGELSGASFTSSSFSLGSMDAELRRAA